VEKDTNTNRENKHFTDRWYRDQLEARIPCKLPHSFDNKKTQAVRELVYQEWKRAKRAKAIKTIVISVVIGTAIAFAVTMLGFRI
jgi:hypothetical protein|tara:strand:- start:57 stop:311 length:255 start_codon:yes stop_codon:yes gene_type:complete